MFFLLEYESPNLSHAVTIHIYIDNRVSRVTNQYSDDSLIGRAFNRIYRLLEVDRHSINTTDPSQFEFQVWSSSFTCFWRYSLPNVVSKYSNDHTFDFHFRTPSLSLL